MQEATSEITALDTEMTNQKTQIAWNNICIAHLTRCICDRSYSFFLPLYLSKFCHGSFRPTAALGIVQNISVALLSTFVAKVYKTSGPNAFVMATTIENIAVAIGGVSIAMFVKHAGINDRCDNPLSSHYFKAALILGAIDAIFSSFLSLIISKEWVATLFNSNNEGTKHEKLAKGNALLSQIDLAVGTLCPIVISFLLQRFGYNTVLAVMVTQHLLGAMVIIACIRKSLNARPDLALEAPSNKDLSLANKTKQLSFPKLFMMLPIRTKLIATAYVLLYFTVLSPSAMMNSWMISLDQDLNIVSEQTVAYFGSASQFCGALATFLSPFLIRNITSLPQASAISQWFQTIFILYGAWCFYLLNTIESESLSNSLKTEEAFRTLIIQFLVSLSLSRVGLWTFDLVERQLIQESVPRSYQTFFFNGEKACAQVLTLLMMILCYVYPHPSSFGILVASSVSAVCLSSLLIFFSNLVR